MKKSLIISLTLIATLLTGCNKKSLRSDIAKFIASFSLENAMSSYTNARYIDVETFDDGNEIKIVTKTFTFSVENEEELEYEFITSTTIDGAEIESTREYISKANENYNFHKSDGTIENYTSEQCYGLIRNFFFTRTYIDGQFHTGAMYVGDEMMEYAIDYQNYIKIDEDSHTLNRKFTFKNINIDGIIYDEASEDLLVDTVGMIISAITTRIVGEKSVTHKINTYKNINIL